MLSLLIWALLRRRRELKGYLNLLKGVVEAGREQALNEALLRLTVEEMALLCLKHEVQTGQRGEGTS